MTTRSLTSSRAGLTLTEALIALFVAAIGMIALMTLFPLGALQMGQALKDSRTSQLAEQADGIMRWYWREFVLTGSDSVLWEAMTDPDAGEPTFPSASQSEISYPVFVDPMGWVARPDPFRNWIGDNYAGNNPTFGLPRRTLFQFNNPFYPGGITNTRQAIEFCSLLDDLTYGDDGLPPSGTIERQGRYNWLAVLQRPRNGVRESADLTIVVFDGRAPGYAPIGSEMRFGNVNLTPGTTAVIITFTGERPPITKGRWLMDATTQSGSRILRHANFYRVVSVVEEANGQLFVELQEPIRTSDNQPAPYTGTLVLMPGVAEVFRRPPLTP